MKLAMPQVVRIRQTEHLDVHKGATFIFMTAMISASRETAPFSTVIRMNPSGGLGRVHEELLLRLTRTATNSGTTGRLCRWATAAGGHAAGICRGNG